MAKKNCSDCKRGALDRFTNPASCPFYSPTKDKHCSMWVYMDERNQSKLNKSEVTKR